MTNEKNFYQELGRVPDVPDGLYGLASGKIHRQAVLARAVVAVAALFIVAAGTTGVLIVHKGNNRGLSVEAADELQMVTII